MIFYCTTRVDNYHKVGISETLGGVKKRLTTYRSISPKIQILFFTEVANAQELERSFKNKFQSFRVGRSECYRLRPDIIFSHVLKFIHREHNENVLRKGQFIKRKKVKAFKLLSIWRKGRFHLSNYYLDDGYKGLDFLNNRTSDSFKFEDANNPFSSYDLNNNQLYYWDILNGFFPLCEISEYYKRDKEGEIIEKSKQSILMFADLSSKNKFDKFNKIKKSFLIQYYKQKTHNAQLTLFRNFIKNNFKKKIFKKNNPYIFFQEFIYNCIKNSKPELLKGYLARTDSLYGDFSNAHKRLRYSGKIRNIFTETNYNLNRNRLSKIIAKISYYPIDEFYEIVKELIELPPFYLDYNFDKNKSELLMKIRRILIVHNRDAYKIIDKHIEEYKKNYDKS